MATRVDPAFKAYSDKSGIHLFEIGDVNGIVFYRAHNPEKKGDDKSGKDTIQKGLSGQAIVGAETGSSGIAIRALYQKSTI